MILLPREERAEGLKGSKGLKAVEVSSLITLHADSILQKGKRQQGRREREWESRRKKKWDRNTARDLE